MEDKLIISQASTNDAKQIKAKDFWDKLDVIGKVLSAVILGVMALVIKAGTDNIATSLHKGDFVRNLISDLAIPSPKVRRDIALIALDHALSKEEDSKLVGAISERVLRTLPPEEKTIGCVAFAVLKRRDPDLAKKIEQEAVDLLNNTKANRSNPTDPSKPACLGSDQQQLPTFVTGVFPNVIYIQYKHSKMKEFADTLRGKLQEKGLHAPGIELVNADYCNSIRYFHSEDGQAAMQAAQLISEAVKEQKIQVQFKVEFISKSKFKSPKGQVEVWINLDRNN